MKKKNIQIDIPFNFDGYSEVSIEQLKEDLNKLEELGANFICIPWSDCDIEAKFIREETDEEFERRKEKEKEKAKISENEIIERRIYERLHLKYGKE